MKITYDVPESKVEAQYMLEDVAACSGGPIVLPDDDFQ